MSDLNEKEILNEIMGTFVPQRPPNQPYANQPNPPHADNLKNTNVSQTNITVGYCSRLEGWQRNIVETLSGNKGHDQYIIARPGGGKTTPVFCYWSDRLLGLNTMAGNSVSPNIGSGIYSLFSGKHRQNIPKMLMMVPVIVLAQQTGMEIRSILSNIMMQIYNTNPDLIINTYLQNSQIQNLQTQITNLTHQLTQTQDPSIQTRIHQSLNSINQSLKTEVENVISDLVNRMVYVKTGGDSSKTPIEEALVFVTIYESAAGIIDKIKDKNLQLTVIDEAHLIQESGIENDDNSRAYQIMGNLFNILKKIKDIKNNRLVMLSGTINPKSALQVITYFNDCFGRNFTTPVAAPSDASNRSQLSVITNDRIGSDKDIVNSIVRSVSQRDWGQLYVLFGTGRILRIVEMCIDKIGVRDIENSSPSGYTPSNVFSGLGQHRQNNSGYSLDKSSVDRMSIPPGKQFEVSNIINPLLRQAVLRGIGFISRNIPGNPLEERDQIKMADSDKIIVAKLFRERKINVLLATDAVGIGVNIDVKDLYIPYIQKYNDKIQNMVNASLRDLAQILNRAGRGATPIASIQTSSQNVEMVTNALYANPDDLPEVGEIRRIGINPCDSKSFMNLWKKL
jgi:gas vesicle protein